MDPPLATMKVLLLYPEFPDTFWSFKHAMRFIRKKAALPPLGLVTVAAMLPEAWELRLVDTNTEKLRERDLAWADTVLVSAMIAQRKSAIELVARCREAGKRIVAGGPLFGAEHGEAHFAAVDHFVLGEAEAILPEFLDDFAAGRARRLYEAQAWPDLASVPVPRWDLVNLRRYASACVQYSRGCPFDCEFCSITAMFGHRPRVKPAERMIAELEALWKAGWRGTVFFVDDNFIGNKRSLRGELLPALIDWRRRRPGLTFYTEASINLADDPGLMEMMVEAGFDQVFVGIETPEEAALAECNKRQNRKRDLVADVKRIQRAGLQVQGGFIVGFDSDPVTIFQRQIDFIQESGIVTAMVGLLQAIPGTRLYERMRDEGRLSGEEISGDNADGSTNFVPRMDRETLREGYRQLMNYLYAPGPYYRRIRTFLRESPPPRFPQSLQWRNLRAFLAANVILGIFSRERFHYWGLLLWTCLRQPRLLTTAVTLSIFGYHFRRCSAALQR